MKIFKYFSILFEIREKIYFIFNFSVNELSKVEFFYSYLVPKITLMSTIIRTVHQGRISDKSISSPEYLDALAICLIHPKDMKKLGIKKGNLKITSEFGSVIVKAVETEKETEEGHIFLPLGPWSNQISGAINNQLILKNFKVRVEVTNEKITDINPLFKKED